MKFRLLFAVAAICFCGFGCGQETERHPEILSDHARMSRIGTRAMRDIGWDVKVVAVTPGKSLPDGSYLVTLMLESGREVTGRLYRDRARYKIAVDRSSFLNTHITIKMEQEE